MIFEMQENEHENGKMVLACRTFVACSCSFHLIRYPNLWETYLDSNGSNPVLQPHKCWFIAEVEKAVREAMAHTRAQPNVNCGNFFVG